MKNPVMIKGNKYGIVLVLDDEMAFEELITIIGEKFSESNKFFDSANQVAITFEGRSLSNEEQSQILDVIADKCQLKIPYIIDSSNVVETQFKEILEQQAAAKAQAANEALALQTDQEIQAEPEISNDGQFYKGTLRSGRCLDVESSIVVVGDVNPGASVTAKGNIVILGCLKGTVYAGSDGNDKAFVVALDMNPMQIRIGNIIARAPDRSKPKTGFLKHHTQQEAEAKIAFVEDHNIYIEAISRSVLNDISIGY